MGVTHCKGWANGLSDAGSRDKMSEMRALAEAYGMRLREVPSLHSDALPLAERMGVRAVTGCRLIAEPEAPARAQGSCESGRRYGFRQ